MSRRPLDLEALLLAASKLGGTRKCRKQDGEQQSGGFPHRSPPGMRPYG
jgi:hypothetical protein